MYEHLKSPGRIGPIELRNRIAMAGMGVEVCEEDGFVGDRMIAYYEERARGGVGLVITEVGAVAYPKGATTAHQIGLSDDKYIPGLSKLARAVHRHGAKVAAQLVHHGKVARLDTIQGREILMPSEPAFHGAMDMMSDLAPDEVQALLAAFGGAAPKIRPASKQDIAWLVEQFAAAAGRLAEAGFDGVELHAAHGYILSEFLSPAWNRRDDEYGGSRENRARLLQEVIRACKERTGDGFAVWCRIDAEEFRTPGGITLEDAKVTARLAEEAGAQAINVSAYADSTCGGAFTEAPLVHKPAGYVANARAIKACVGIPVIAVGRIEPEVGDELIRDGGADIIAMARKMLADPHVARKICEGRPEDVRPCVYCYTCVEQPFFDRRVKCAVNPVVANELELHDIETTRAVDRKRVVIVGGGPAGQEAARVAALRGHDVTLLEKASQLGGTLRFASLVYEPNERLLRWLARQVEGAGVDVRLETEATPELVRQLGPDVLLLALGARRAAPGIPGVEADHVFDGDDLRALLSGEGAEQAAGKLSLAGRLAVRAGRAVGVTRDPSKLRQASRAWMPVGQQVCVIGGGLVGCELAEFLAERGREVTVLEESDTLAREMALPRRWRVLEDLRREGVELVKNARISEIGAKSVFYHADGQEREAPAETVILATGLHANDAEVARYQGLAERVEVLGDCSGVSYIEGAIHDGFRAGASI
jgi:2,4-dienoyl-CoA reductase (NADPH2)